MPITIRYHVPEEEDEETESKDNTRKSPVKASSPKKRDLFVKSFANYDFSFSDRLLSEQFPVSEQEKSEGSSSLRKLDSKLLEEQTVVEEDNMPSTATFSRLLALSQGQHRKNSN